MSAESGEARLISMGALLGEAPCGFMSFGDDGTVELANVTLLKMLDYEADEIIGHHVQTILTVGTRIFYQTHWFPLLRMHGRADEIFLMLQAKSGDPVGVLANAVRHERGGAPAYDCVIMRVRERQKYEDELLRARKVADGARQEVEEQKVELERANELLSAQNIELEVQQQQLQEQAAELEAASEELITTNEELLERTEELIKARETAEEANRAKSTFLAVMSHELRTPLNAISGYAELMDMEIHGPVTDAQREDLARIKRSQRHLLRLINDILNLARIESGHVDYRTDIVELASIIVEILPMVEPQMEKKEIAFEPAVASGYVVRADRDKVQQILLNLLSNAIKFTPGGGRIMIEARADTPDMVLLNVTDTGIGIPEPAQATVFDPFVQVDVSMSGRKEGTGLGLAISRDLARGMGGDLSLMSVEGQGSTFTLALPAAASGEPELAP